MADFEETWKAWVRRFWWLRGVTTALALTALVPTFIDLSRYEFLRSFHAVIVGWNLVTEKIGQVIGKIPFLPTLSGDVISTIIFFISIVMPAFFAYTKIKTVRYYPVSITINKLIDVGSSIISIILTPIVYYAIITDSFNNTMLVGFILLLMGAVFSATVYLPGYGKGLIFVITFITVMGILYLLKTPWLADQINQFACEALEAPPENCLPSTEGS